MGHPAFVMNRAGSYSNLGVAGREDPTLYVFVESPLRKERAGMGHRKLRDHRGFALNMFCSARFA